MDNRKAPPTATTGSKKKRKKKNKPKLDAVIKTLDLVDGNASTSTPITEQPNNNSPTIALIPEVTITPPEEDGNIEIYSPPEVNILKQSSSKKKKKKKEKPAAPVVKDEVRPSAVLGYSPHSLRNSVSVQPTVSELEETSEEAEGDFGCNSEDQVDSSYCSNADQTRTLSQDCKQIAEALVNCSSSTKNSRDGFVPESAVLVVEVSSSGETSVNNFSYSDSVLSSSTILSDILTNSVIHRDVDTFCSVENTTFNLDSSGDPSSVVNENESVLNGSDSLVTGEESSLNSQDHFSPQRESVPATNCQEEGENCSELNGKASVVVVEKMPEVAKPDCEQKTKAQLKAERKAAFEAQKGSVITTQKAQTSGKSKAELKAERRAIQEAQRASKEIVKDPAKAQQPATADVPKKPAEEKKRIAAAGLTISDGSVKKQVAKVSPEKEHASPKMQLFSHLPQFKWDPNISCKLGLSGKVVHPSLIQAGLKMAQGLISGSDARCVAALAAFREVIKDYSTPPQKELSRDLDSKVKSATEFLNKCRPLSVSMTNAIKELRMHITQIPSALTEAEAKEQLYDKIETFIRDRIILSKEAIAAFASEKIQDNFVILTYGCSPLVKEVLAKAQATGKTFRVIVVDARPALDGRGMVKFLNERKIECSYVLVNAVSYVMKEVDIVLLDCHSLQANGYVMSRVGSSQIALVAQASNVPVLVCCETYKFCDRVLTDAFVDNELGNPEDWVKSWPTHRSYLESWKDIPHLNLVNIAYDVTPADLVTVVVTELGMLPCTSVPVVLRVKHLAMPEGTHK